jgi:dihydroxyacid dehydratase/phosphogluconate dehydratase
MGARTSIKIRLPNRRATAGPERAHPAIADQCGIAFDRFDVAEIFKKTPYIADLKPGRRYVAKDMLDLGGIPLPMKTLLGDVGTLNVKLTDAKPAEPKTKWQPRPTNHTSGALLEYARLVGPAVDGAVIHSGDAHEKQCYADI